MSDSFNGFKELAPLMKDSYAKKLSKPISSDKYFKHLKTYINKAKRRQKIASKKS